MGSTLAIAISLNKNGISFSGLIEPGFELELLKDQQEVLFLTSHNNTGEALDKALEDLEVTI